MTDIDFDFDPRTTRPATGNQIVFVASLREQYDEAKAEIATLKGETFVPTAWDELPATMTDASRAIEKGKAAVAKARADRNALREVASETTAAKNNEDPEGLWIGRTGQIYKIQHAHNGSGALYVKVWDKEAESFEYVGGGRAVYNVTRECRRMTLDEAKSFGQLYGTCCMCGRTLTDEDSIAAGIGPICASKF
jgi:hypothetical protein